MSSRSLLIMYFIFDIAITVIQGQRGLIEKNLVIYDPKSGKQVAAKMTESDEDGELKIVNLPLYWIPCQCRNLQCNCCIGIRLRNRNVDRTVCIRVTLVLSTVTLRVVILVETRVLLRVSVNVLNPPATCIPILLPAPLYLCFKISDIVLPIMNDFEGCFSVLLKFMSQTVFNLKLGCVQLGAGNVRFYKPSPASDEFVSSEEEREDIIRDEEEGISLEFPL